MSRHSSGDRESRRSSGDREHHSTTKAALKVQTVTRGHLSRQNTRFLSVDMPALVNQWLDSGCFEAIVWDFDRTVLRVHAFARGVQVEEVASRWEKDVADLDFFRAMVFGATQRGMRVGIASFGRQPVVLEYMRHIFADAPGIFTSQNVLTPGALPGFQDGMEVKNGKPMLLALLCSAAPAISERSRVLFFDDDHANIDDCRRLPACIMHAPCIASHTPCMVRALGIQTYLPCHLVDVSHPHPAGRREEGFVYAFHTPDYFARYALWLITNMPPSAPQSHASGVADWKMGPTTAKIPAFSVSRQPSLVVEEPQSPDARPDPALGAALGASMGAETSFRTLMASGHTANRAGELERARQCFEEASHRISAYVGVHGACLVRVRQ